jgi:glycine cleavage system H protein
VNKGDIIAEVESVKSVSGIYAPVSGKVVKLNGALSSNPSLLNTSPENDGWILEIDSNEFAQAQLLNADSYKEFCDKEDQDH